MMPLFSTCVSLIWSVFAYGTSIKQFFYGPFGLILIVSGSAYFSGFSNWNIFAWLIYLIPMSLVDIRTKSIRIVDLIMLCILSGIGQSLQSLMLKSVPAVLICGALIAIKWLLKQLYKQDVFGGADIFVIVSMGIALSMKEFIVGIYLAILSSALIGAIIVMVLKQSKQTLIPFIPFLSFGSWIASIYGTIIYNTYHSLI